MTTLADILSDVQGLRNDAATSIADAYPTVDALAKAKVDDLVEIKGVGAVMAQRILDAAATTDVKQAADKATKATTKAATTASTTVSRATASTKATVTKATTETGGAAQESIGFARGTIAGLIATAERVSSTALAAATRAAGDGVEWTPETEAGTIDRVAGMAGTLVGRALGTGKRLSTSTLKFVGQVTGR